MSFRGVFIALVLSTGMIVAAFMLQAARPRHEVNRTSAALVKATGKCADCHRHETSAVVHEYDMSKHNQVGVNCLDCHQPSKGQEPLDHKGFTIARRLSAANCQTCHAEQYQQYLKSRHAAPAWAAVTGKARLFGRAGRLRREDPPRGRRPPATRPDQDRRDGRGQQGMPPMPRCGPAQRRWLDRIVHVVPCPARLLG